MEHATRHLPQQLGPEDPFDVLRGYFGAAWSFHDIALWISARARAGLPPWAAEWSKDYEATRRRRLGDWED